MFGAMSMCDAISMFYKTGTMLIYRLTVNVGGISIGQPSKWRRSSLTPSTNDKQTHVRHNVMDFVRKARNTLDKMSSHSTEVPNLLLNKIIVISQLVRLSLGIALANLEAKTI